MKENRMLGNYAENLAIKKKISEYDLAMRLGCTPEQIHAFYKGRYYLSFDQLVKLAKTLDVSVQELLAGDEEQYDRTAVHYDGEFKKVENREKIMDLIHSYLDIVNAVGNTDKIN